MDPNLNLLEQLFESLTGWTRSQAALDRVVHTVIRILLIVTITIITRKILYAITKRIRRRMAVGGLSEEEKRAATLISLMRTVISVLLVFIAVTMILGELNISIGPLLASAGVLGLAVGFGAQNLVRDVVSGFFMLLENQFREGDVIETLGVSGKVERFGLRATVLRDQLGRVHYIPNGEIKLVSNLTQEWSQAQLDVTVAYQEDLDRVMSLLTTLCREMEADPDTCPEHPQVRSPRRRAAHGVGGGAPGHVPHAAARALGGGARVPAARGGHAPHRRDRDPALSDPLHLSPPPTCPRSRRWPATRLRPTLPRRTHEIENPARSVPPALLAIAAASSAAPSAARALAR